ncbi:MAG TPA: NapC/NirT family cytochrome c [Blastocatellia bacterium]|nr:NapC/NirT family cytochrome c [Blastocatellia bacterium]
MTSDKTDGSDAPRPSLFRNFTSLFGMIIAMAAIIGVLLLFITAALSSHHPPYVGIFLFIIFPAFLILGILIMLLGAVKERRRRHRLAPGEIAKYLTLDLNDKSQRRRFVAFVFTLLVFLFISAFGSYRAYEYTESVTFCGQLCHAPMNPEFTAYMGSPHARVRCVDCHVGPGAEWYLRSKVSGAYQVYSVMFNKYPRPIPTPVHNLRPAQDTCEQCHWPEKFYGSQLKVFNHYGYDETNTLRQTRMMINTGGGSPEHGKVSGIHWHMNIANEITYIASDENRQTILWVRLKDQSGNVTEYLAPDAQLTSDEIERSFQRKVDCVDCHSRPSHVYNPPDRSVNEAFDAGRLDTSLPFLKQQAVEVLTKPYETRTQALDSIRSSIEEYYKSTYPEVSSNKRESINQAIEEIRRIYSTNFFPEMKVDWQTHNDNQGHYYAVGCFRCHDGEHKSKDGKVIRKDCNICHTVLDQSEGGTPVAITNGLFKHPLELDVSENKCTDCHSGKGMSQ